MTDLNSLPSGPTPPETVAPRNVDPARRLTRSRHDSVIGGVCGGFAHYLGVDPTAVRIVTIAMLFTGVGVIGYLVAWIAIPLADEDESEEPGERDVRQRTTVVGVTLIALGVLLVARMTLPWFGEVPLWPVLIIGGGVLLLWTGRR